MAQTSPEKVHQHATKTGIFDQERISLIGIAGTPAAPRALLRLSGGTVTTVQPGDTIKGRTVVAIGEDQVRLTRNGQMEKLSMPGG